MLKCELWVLLFSLILYFAPPAHCGIDEAKLTTYFDSLIRQDPEGFEAWYSVKKEKIPNPRVLSFDAARAVGGNWDANTATAVVASYQSKLTYESVVKIISDATLTSAWLRDVGNVIESQVVARDLPEEKSQIRMTLGMPFLTDLNGLFVFTHVTISDQRSILRMTQASDEGPAQDTQMMILVDRNRDQTAFIHMVYIVILKPKYRTNFLTRIWFKFKSQRNIESLIQTLGSPPSSRD